MGKTKSAKRPVASSFTKATGVAIKKETKQRNRRLEWASKLSRLQHAKQIEQQSKKAPLQHYELLQDSLATITAEMQAKAVQAPSKADQTRNKVRSGRARSANLY